MPLVVTAGASMDSDAMLADARRRLRRLEKHTVGGFDPNEAPVIIGQASTTAGSTPDNLLPVDESLVVIGLGAYYSGGTGSPAVSLGFGATTSDNGTALGPNALAIAGYDTAIGDSAGASGGWSTAIGSGSVAGAAYATSLGFDASAGPTGSVAIGCDSGGTGATAFGPNDYVHGTVNHNHFMPGLPTSDPANSGQLWNNGGVVSVSP